MTNTNIRQRPERAWQNTLFDLMRIAIALGYVVFGAFILLVGKAFLIIDESIAPYFGAALLVYGLFRLYRAVRLILDRRVEQQENDDEAGLQD